MPVLLLQPSIGKNPDFNLHIGLVYLTKPNIRNLQRFIWYIVIFNPIFLFESKNP